MEDNITLICLTDLGFLGFFPQIINLKHSSFDFKLVWVIFQYYKIVFMGSFYFGLF